MRAKILTISIIAAMALLLSGPAAAKELQPSLSFARSAREGLELSLAPPGAQVQMSKAEGAVTAQQGWNVELMDQIGGATHTVAV
jgi:hypothetical protein